MATEALTQYKLMILYLLHSVKYPLSNSRLSGFLLENEYTTYFTLQQCINDLVEASLISAEHSQSTTRYEITEEGKQTLSFFSQDIPELVREDMDLFLCKVRRPYIPIIRRQIRRNTLCSWKFGKIAPCSVEWRLRFPMKKAPRPFA